ncbi:hypothetical protein BB561_002703 [Smittium simulii]|uniref:Uncharacterized protein n=1 Tax=Smittium simulii TaxID=133385 RepID=A0A2T9YPH3_9FUNG|nr:hypothetical protein BB561_002703 [Smittium simulii]
MPSDYKPKAEQNDVIEIAAGRAKNWRIKIQQLRPEALANIIKDKEKIVEKSSKTVKEVTYLVGQKKVDFQLMDTSIIHSCNNSDQNKSKRGNARIRNRSYHNQTWGVSTEKPMQ